MGRKSIVLTLLGVIVALGAFAAVAYSYPVFKVSQVAVSGNAHVTAEDIEATSGVVRGENLLRFSPRGAAESVAALPWVKTVTVDRALPNTVKINVTEREAVAYMEQADGPHLIDAEGTDFAIEMPPQEAVAIIGGESGSEEWKGAVEILSSLPADLRSAARELNASDALNYVFTMDDERTITWGANEDNANKARAMAAVMKMEGARWNITNPTLVSSS